MEAEQDCCENWGMAGDSWGQSSRLSGLFKQGDRTSENIVTCNISVDVEERSVKLNRMKTEATVKHISWTTEQLCLILHVKTSEMSWSGRD